MGIYTICLRKMFKSLYQMTPKRHRDYTVNFKVSIFYVE